MQPPEDFTTDSHSVDFLVVTALKDEYTALVSSLPEFTVEGPDTLSSIPRKGSPGSFRIAIVVTGQTTVVAAVEVKDAISRRNPRAVLFAGIAAGFPEAGVDFGDVLAPFWIVPYEYAKISEQSTTTETLPSLRPDVTPTSSRPTIKVEHRGDPFPVSRTLWRAAEALGRDPTGSWLKRIRTERPRSTKPIPTVHTDLAFKLGSGDKLVASEFAEVREWLIAKYGTKAIGLEMEGYGALIACNSVETPFLLAKASQDPATTVKDNLTTKDEWRAYACDAAAAFVLTLIETYNFPAVLRHVNATTSALPVCFAPASDNFSALIGRNFLFEFAGKDSDYLQLLSADLRRVFSRVFNEHLRSRKTNRMVIAGREGSGKTFNTFLLSLQLSRHGYDVYYCHDVIAGSLTPEHLRTVAARTDKFRVFIIDNIQHDLIKAADLVASISKASAYSGMSLFLFLTRPLDKEARLDVFGTDTPVLYMEDKFIDFGRLVRLFFKKSGIPEAADSFLKNEHSAGLPHFVVQYRNMAFWNEVLRSFLESDSRSLTEEHILKRAHSFFSRKEPQIIESREALSRLLPLFGQGVAIQWDYTNELLGHEAGKVIQEFEEQGLARIAEQDWDWEWAQYEKSSTLVVAPSIHTTKAKLLAKLFSKYYGCASDPVEALAAYAQRFPQNLHYLLGPYYKTDELKSLFDNSLISAAARQYLLKRHIGRELDRFVQGLSTLDQQKRDSLLDSEVLDAFAEKINGGVTYLVSKVCLLRALYRTDSKKATVLFKRLHVDGFAGQFLKDPTERSVTSLAKAMEHFKNIYKLVELSEDKQAIQSFVRQVIEKCRTEFLRRIDKHDPYFTQLHWILKRLAGLRLDSYFLEGIAPEFLLRLIRTKDTNIVELSKSTLAAALHAQWTEPDGSRRGYYNILKDTLSYDDLKRIFDNKRSDLFDIAINANHDLVAKALVSYAEDPHFAEKAILEKSHLRDRSIDLIRANPLFTESEKHEITKPLRAARFASRL